MKPFPPPQLISCQSFSFFHPLSKQSNAQAIGQRKPIWNISETVNKSRILSLRFLPPFLFSIFFFAFWQSYFLSSKIFGHKHLKKSLWKKGLSSELASGAESICYCKSMLICYVFFFFVRLKCKTRHLI